MEAAPPTAFVLDYPAGGIDKQVRQTVSKIERWNMPNRGVEQIWLPWPCKVKHQGVMHGICDQVNTPQLLA